MKKLFTQVFTLLLLFVSSAAYAQHNVYVWKKGGDVTVMNSNDVDSVSFSIGEWLYSINTSSAVGVTERSFEAKASVSMKDGIKSLSVTPTIGVCYSTKTDHPTIENAICQTLGSSMGTYNISVKGLLKGNKYFYRTYVKLLDNVFYSNVQSITTLGDKEEVLGEYRKVVNGHVFVNLGLPSGLYWATCNVGAETETDYGNYYAWGETTTKSRYIPDNSTWFDRFHSGDLTPSEDAATAYWGKGTRMPTFDEMLELENNCTWEWQDNYNNTSVNGYLVTGHSGQSVFFPAAGFRSGPDLGGAGAGSNGYYWTSSPISGSYYDSCLLSFINGDVFEDYYYERHFGLSVRAVCQ